MAAISSRVRPVFEILRTASAVEPDMAQVHAEIEGYRAANMRQFTQWLATNASSVHVPLEPRRRDHLGPGQPRCRPAAVRRAGLGGGRAAPDWLKDTLVRTLLPDVDPKPG